jgi:outer membrane exchange protein TraA
MLVQRTCTALALAGALALAAGRAGATPVVIPTATADALQGQGQGLCVANAISTNPAGDFPNGPGSKAVFIAGINAFMEANKANWKEYVERTIFDLSNNQGGGLNNISWGDFINSMSPQCQTGGCDLAWNDATTSFASRFRGFLDVTPELAGVPVHIGFYADDAVSLTIWDKTPTAYAIMIQPPALGFPTWRLTETVTFMQPGLYPLEVLYAQIGEYAALEMSYFTGAFTDIDSPSTQVPPDGGMNPNLSTAGFTLFPVTRFFQTLSGAPSYPSLDQCKQCDRLLVGQAGNTGCDPSYYCNEAALCAPCDTDLFCGPSCMPCGGMTPFCVATNGMPACAECRTDKDCQMGSSCDPTTHTCISSTSSGGTGGSGGAGGGVPGGGMGGASSQGMPHFSGSCHCRTVRASSSDPGVIVGAALFPLLVVVRRRRRQAQADEGPARCWSGQRRPRASAAPAAGRSAAPTRVQAPPT